MRSRRSFSAAPWALGDGEVFYGQYHLDLMAWFWKLGFVVAASGLTVIMALAGGTRALPAGALLLAVLIGAGWVTYYHHLNEPTDEDETTDQVTRYRRGQSSRAPRGQSEKCDAKKERLPRRIEFMRQREPVEQQNCVPPEFRPSNASA